jgi:hypothetical protein
MDILLTLTLFLVTVESRLTNPIFASPIAVYFCCKQVPIQPGTNCAARTETFLESKTNESKKKKKKKPRRLYTRTTKR